MFDGHIRISGVHVTPTTQDHQMTDNSSSSSASGACHYVGWYSMSLMHFIQRSLTDPDTGVSVFRD